ncbi:unnamed protein product [Rhodiola kirilowii]
MWSWKNERLDKCPKGRSYLLLLVCMNRSAKYQAEVEAAYKALREEYKDEPILPYMATIFEQMTHQF